MSGMSGMTAGTRPEKARLGAFLDPPIWQGPVALLATAVLTASAWVGGLLLPYLVDDPRDRSPVIGGPLGELLGLAGYLAAMGGAVVVGCVAVWTTWSLAGRWSLTSPRLRLVYLCALAVSVVTFGVLVSPFARDLLAWALD
jgi:hypothetical protein